MPSPRLLDELMRVLELMFDDKTSEITVVSVHSAIVSRGNFTRMPLRSRIKMRLDSLLKNGLLVKNQTYPMEYDAGPKWKYAEDDYERMKFHDC